MSKRRVLCVGSAASSGSTLLADLLDAVPGIVCGPELNVFCMDAAYCWDRAFKQDARNRRPFPVDYSIVRRSQFFNTRHLGDVGLDLAGLDRLIAKARSLPAFVDAFADRYAAYRGRDVRVLAEKTPHNLAYSAAFREVFPDGVFAVVVRDGRAVASSLRRRGYTLYEAALSWLWESRVGENAVEEGAVEVRYDELVSAPFATVAALAARVGVEADEAQIRSAFEENAYRSGLHRVDTWRAASYAGAIRSGYGFQELKPDELAFLEALVLVRPDGARVGFTETLERHGWTPAAERPSPGPDALERFAREYLERSENVDHQEQHALLLGNVDEAAQRKLLARLRAARARRPAPRPPSAP